MLLLSSSTTPLSLAHTHSNIQTAGQIKHVFHKSSLIRASLTASQTDLTYSRLLFLSSLPPPPPPPPINWRSACPKRCPFGGSHFFKCILFKIHRKINPVLHISHSGIAQSKHFPKPRDQDQKKDPFPPPLKKIIKTLEQQPLPHHSNSQMHFISA